jgi:hypothetical protein
MSSEITARTDTFGYAGSATDFVYAAEAEVLRNLEEHHMRLGPQQRPSAQQRESWRQTIDLLAKGLREAMAVHAHATQWQVLLEYELPFEGGRRPDAVVLAGSVVVVVEFKDSPAMSAAHVDQVRAYARDLREYHSVAQNVTVAPVLLYPIDVRTVREPIGVRVVGPSTVADCLTGAAEGPQLPLDTFVEGTYAPLPTLVEAARHIFRDEPLPRLKRADSNGLDGTVHYVKETIDTASAEGGRKLVLIAGVPGAGKTLAGLRTVYEARRQEEAPPSSRATARLSRSCRTRFAARSSSATSTSSSWSTASIAGTPSQRVIVFDEAQRAWDRKMMSIKKSVDASEPDLLVQAADRVPEWCVLVGLVGDGQEIHSGEEGGLGQWRQAIESSGRAWEVHCPPRLAQTFAGHAPKATKRLDLDRSMRSHRAVDLHLWVSRVLGEELDAAALLAQSLNASEFSLRMTRDLGEAKHYLAERYREEPDALYGMLASSHDKDLRALGVGNDFQTTKRVKIHRWFNAPADDPLSACALDRPATEFMCQGLELDMPLVCWGSDLRWEGAGWRTTAINRRIPLLDPNQIVRNTYRVLMTRGRDGLMLFVPPASKYDATAAALEAAGVGSLDAIAVKKAAELGRQHARRRDPALGPRSLSGRRRRRRRAAWRQHADLATAVFGKTEVISQGVADLMATGSRPEFSIGFGPTLPVGRDRAPIGRLPRSEEQESNCDRPAPSVSFPVLLGRKASVHGLLTIPGVR